MPWSAGPGAGWRGGRHAFRFAKIPTADTIHAEARGGNVLGATAEGPGPPEGRTGQDQLGDPEYGFPPPVHRATNSQAAAPSLYCYGANWLGPRQRTDHPTTTAA